MKASKDYIKGLKDGVRMFAWWKDGKQEVGSCGTTLNGALAEIDKEYEPMDKQDDKPD